ncbi:MAG: hypothetical protein AAFZ09_12495 [Pseudomonadota bacterium]
MGDMLLTLGASAPVLAQAGAVEALGAITPGGVAGGAEAADFSLTALFLKATPIVQAVMLMLVAASVWAWAIIVERWMAYRRHARSIAAFEAEYITGVKPVNKDPETYIEKHG